MNPYVNDFSTNVKTYYKELKKYQPISKEKEKELFLKIRNNNIQAKNEILQSHLKFVFNVASKYKGRGVPLEDLISEGNIGLTKAIDKFDEKKGVKFISYAVWWVKQSIQECVKKRKKINTFEIVEENKNDENGKDTLEMVFDDEQIHDDVLTSLNEERLQLISEIIPKLPKRGQYIIKSYYGLDNQEEKNLEKIGNELGLTKERVRQIKEQCLKIIRSEILMSEKFNDLFL